MSLRVLRSLACAALALAAALVLPASAQDADRPAPEISLLTFGPGEIYWQRFGHNAIAVRDPVSGEVTNYNYGIFDFNQKNFFLNFARGWMQYRLASYPLAYDLRNYRREGRWVVEQKLALNPQQRLALRDFLEWNARPENAQYRYDYFRSNCSTRVRDALDRALGGALQHGLKGQATPYSYRHDAVRLIAPDLWLGFGMDLALGPVADRPLDLWDESFVPMALMEALRKVRVMGEEGAEVPLVATERRILDGGAVPEPPAAPPEPRALFLALGLALAAALVLAARMRAHLAARIGFAVLAGAFTLLSGLGGLILVLLWAVTEHWAGWYNENLLLLSPFDWLLLPACVGALRTSWRVSPLMAKLAAAIALGAATALLLRLLPAATQMNLHWILLLLPVHAAIAWSLLRGAR